MERPKALGPDSRNPLTYLELPIGTTSIAPPPEGIKTGLWRFRSPRFKEGLPPCQEACPLGNWITRFTAELARGNMDAALWALRVENPFPGLCGRVCGHPCELSCNRKELDGPVSVQAIERYLADRFFQTPFKAPVTQKMRRQRTAIVGAGPAGLSCAYFLRFMGYQVTIFEASNQPGGIPQSAIPAYRLPREVLRKEIADILSMGVEIRCQSKVGDQVRFARLLEYDAIFLATGAQLMSPISISGQDSKGVYRGLELLWRLSQGEPIELGEDIVILGGGNVAIDAARTLVRMGRKPVIIYRRARDHMPAFSEEVEEALSEGIKISFLLSPTSIRPVEGGKLLVECVRVRLEGKDQSGRPRPVPLEGEGVSFLADQVIAATGQLPELSYLPPDFQIDRGLLRVNRWGQTNIEKVFAGGDIIDRPRSVAEAIGSAKRAAIAMDHYLKGEDLRFLSQRGLMSCTIREHLGLIDSEPRRSERLAEFSQLNTAYVAPKPRTRARKLPVSERNGFEEVNLPIEVEEACYEAERCMSCGVCSLCGNCYVFCPDGAVRRDEARGRYVVDYDYCKGCGICHNECPAAAIVMEADEQ